MLRPAQTDCCTKLDHIEQTLYLLVALKPPRHAFDDLQLRLHLTPEKRITKTAHRIDRGLCTTQLHLAVALKLGVLRNRCEGIELGLHLTST